MQIIENLNLGKELIQVLNTNLNANSNDVLNYLNRLCENDLGEWSDTRAERKDDMPPAKNETLRYVLHLELTTGCNLRCLHCYNESGIAKENFREQPSLGQWKNVIKDAYNMGCRRVQFIGGEPFLRRQMMFKLVSFASNLGYKSLEISSNGTLMSDSDFKILKKYGVNLALSFYSHQYQIHDLITTKKGSWQQTLEAIKKALNIGVNLRISVVAMKQNEQGIDEVIGFLKSLGIKDVKSTAVEPAGRGCNEGLITADICKKQVRNKPHFSKISQNIFWRNKAGHNCFLEHICVGAEGNVYPCLAERKIFYGNIKFTSLKEILSSDTAERFKHLSKDLVEVCRDCEYRYCCFDCRVKAKDYLDKSSYDKPWWCSYNPYTGKWE